MVGAEKIIGFENVKKRLSDLDFKFSIIYMLSEVKLVKVGDFDEKDIDWEEVIEARFFDSEKEFYLFRCNDNKDIMARLINDNNMDYDTEVDEYYIDRRYKNFGNILHLLLVLKYNTYLLKLMK